jgi:hypothetical protein
MDTPYSGISIKDGRPYKGEGNMRGGGGDPGGLPGYGEAVLQGDMFLEPNFPSSNRSVSKQRFIPHRSIREASNRWL